MFLYTKICLKFINLSGLLRMGVKNIYRHSEVVMADLACAQKFLNTFFSLCSGLMDKIQLNLRKRDT